MTGGSIPVSAPTRPVDPLAVSYLLCPGVDVERGRGLDDGRLLARGQGGVVLRGLRPQPGRHAASDL